MVNISSFRAGTIRTRQVLPTDRFRALQGLRNICYHACSDIDVVKQARDSVMQALTTARSWMHCTESPPAWRADQQKAVELRGATEAVDFAVTCLLASTIIYTAPS